MRFKHVALIIIAVISVSAGAYADRNDDWNAWANTCIKHLNSADAAISSGASDALIKLGPDVIPLLIASVDLQKPDTVVKAKRVISKLGKPGREKLQEIIDNKAAPMEVVTALSQVTDNLKIVDRDAIIKVIEPEYDEYGNEVYKDPEKTARKLAAFGSSAGPVLVDYWKTLRDDGANGDGGMSVYRYNQDYAIQRALMKIGDESIAKDLEELVRTNSYAVAPLYRIEGNKAVPLLLEIFKDYHTRKDKGDYNVYEINTVLREAKPKEAVPVLKEIISSADCRDKYNMAETLAEIGGEDALPAIKAAYDCIRKENENTDAESQDINVLTNMNRLIAGMGDKDGVTGLIDLLGHDSFTASDNKWDLAEIINTIRKFTGKDLTENLRPYKDNRIEIMQAYAKWWNEKKANAEWDSGKKRFLIKD